MRLALASLALAAVPAVAAPPAATSDAPDGPRRGEVRFALSGVLEQLPPELGMVFKLDPTLLRNPEYLAPYPKLAEFVAAHPEVALQPQYYFSDVAFPASDAPGPGLSATMDILGALCAFTVFLVVTGVLAWLVKTFVGQRRWRHLVAVQTEAHNKLLDRFASNEELLAYVQSPVGRRFLEATPVFPDERRSPLRAPVGRILGSVQAGIVLGAAGIGLQLVSRSVPPDASRALFAIGLFVISIGVGFVASALVSWFLSRRLGLWPDALTAGGADR